MADGSVNSLGLVGDIGGTNARFALVEWEGERPRLRAPAGFLCSDFPGAEEAIEAYLSRQGGRRPDSVVLAVAGPVNEGKINLTNFTWRTSEPELRRAGGFSRVKLINDYAALAMAAPVLNGEDTHLIGPAGEPKAAGAIAVLGAGTGFGVSALVRDEGCEAILTTEGGHISFAPEDELEVEVWRALNRRFGRVSIERILSGPGLLNLHQALCAVDGNRSEFAEPGALTAAAERGDAAAARTVQRFCAILGAVAGDFALSYGAQGGVYIAGGIAPRLLEHLDGGAFRTRFEAKGRFASYVRPIPTRVILHPHTALLGAARALHVTA